MRPFSDHADDKLHDVLSDALLSERCYEALADAWRSACHDAAGAYGHWAGGSTQDRGDAHAVYRAASDREEAAAQALARAARQLALTGRQPLPAAARGPLV
jgi:hypothetical protein